MASRSFSEEDLSCPVCSDIYKDPVLLTCSHNICTDCLKRFWNAKGFKECPVCRRRCSKEMYPLNRVLKNLCETFQRVEHHKEQLCPLHRSKLRFYCEDDKQVVCLVCRDSKLHTNHNFSPINEAAQERKETLKPTLKPLQDKLKRFTDVKLTCEQTAQHIQGQSQETERQIKQEFEKFHRFLRNEEAARIAALREEEKQKSQMMKEKIEEMSREISSLSDTIRAIEEDMEADDVTFLQNYKTTVKRAQSTLQDPEKISGALINVAKHQGNLKFRVWEKMKALVRHNRPVKRDRKALGAITLDPNTAHPLLCISPDMTNIRFSRIAQLLPDNPERFNEFINVLGSEGFDSGLHSWDVEVGDCSNWDVGVVTESAKRKGYITDRSGVWYVYHRRGNYEVVESLQPRSRLAVSQKPMKIRVLLDCERGRVSLYDADSNTHLHTFTHTFIERVFPYFGSQCPQVPLRIVL